MAAIVGICMLPWNLLKSSNNFTSYLSAYSVFLSSIAGVMVLPRNFRLLLQGLTELLLGVDYRILRDTPRSLQSN